MQCNWTVLRNRLRPMIEMLVSNEDMILGSAFFASLFLVWCYCLGCNLFPVHTNHVCIYISGSTYILAFLIFYCSKYFLYIGDISRQFQPNEETTNSETENLSTFLTAKWPASFSSDINLISNRWHAFVFWNGAKKMYQTILRKYIKLSADKNVYLTFIGWV